MMAVKYYLDRELLNNLPADIRTILIQKQLVTSNCSRVSFCGVIISNEQPVIFFPRSTDIDFLDTNLKLNLSKKLLNALNKYVLPNKSAIRDTENPDVIKEFDSLNLYIWLLEDYFNNGLYVKKAKQKIFNSTKVHWGKTIKNEIPYLINNAPIYFKTHGIKNTTSSDQLISAIHTNIINDIYKKFGWLLINDPSFKLDLPSNTSISKLSSQTAVSIINKELQNSYTDRDIHLLNKLKSYINKDKFSLEGKIILGVKFFQHAWEYMLHHITSDKIDVNKLFPHPDYIDINNEKFEAKNKSLKTDIVIENKTSKTLYIVDAKYYQATQVSNSPSWKDILKQLYYADFLKNHYEGYKLINYFIFPGTQAKFKTVEIIDQFQNLSINCAYLDPKVLIDLFISNKLSNNYLTEYKEHV